MGGYEVMSFFERGTRGRVKKPLFVALYSGPGIGKTSFFASFPKPYFFDFEESTHNIDVMRHRPSSFSQVMDDLEEIYNESKITDFKSLIFDTVDELERLMHRQIASDKGKDSIDDIGWQKGYNNYSIDKLHDFISLCREIRDKHNIHIGYSAHAQSTVKIDLEKGLSYNRYSMALHRKAAEYLFGQVDIVLFAKKDMALRQTSDERVIAKDLNKRILHTNYSALYDAKNRIGLPDTLPMPQDKGFNVLWAAYNKAFDATPESLYQECLAEMKGVKDEKLKKQMSDYCEINKADLSIMRSTLQRIKDIKKEQKDG